jgi:hypothetical protein
MIKIETKLNILHITVHVSYHSTKGKIEQSLHIGRHSTGIDTLGPFLVLIFPLLLLVHLPLERFLHLLVELLHLLEQHLLRLDLPPHMGDVLPRARKASWTSLLKVYLLASICVARTPRRSVSIGDIWMRSF